MLLSKWHGVDVLFLCTPTCGHLFASEWGPLARFWCWPIIYYRGNAFESLNISYISLLCVRLLFSACEWLSAPVLQLALGTQVTAAVPTEANK